MVLMRSFALAAILVNGAGGVPNDTPNYRFKREIKEVHARHRRTKQCVASLHKLDAFIANGSNYFSDDIKSALESTNDMSDASKAEPIKDLHREDPYLKVDHACGSSSLACRMLGRMRGSRGYYDTGVTSTVTLENFEENKELAKLKAFLSSEGEGMVTIDFEHPETETNHVFTLFKCGRNHLKMYQSWVFQDHEDQLGYSVKQHLEEYPHEQRTFTKDPKLFYKQFTDLIHTIVNSGDGEIRDECSHTLFGTQWKKLFGTPYGWECFKEGNKFKIGVDIEHGLNLELLDRVTKWEWRPDEKADESDEEADESFEDQIDWTSAGWI